MTTNTPRCAVCLDAGTHIVSGRRTSHGCVTGKVYILLDPSRSSAVPEGAVLVTPMTDPDCVPAMQRVAAIVTDRGGAMCHAALVAREIKKPCVVGTKTATSSLRDGQLVRVCANRGIVVHDL